MKKRKTQGYRNWVCSREVVFIRMPDGDQSPKASIPSARHIPHRQNPLECRVLLRASLFLERSCLGGNCRRRLTLYCHDLYDCGGSRAVGLSDGPQITSGPVYSRYADRLFHIPSLATLLTSAGRSVCTRTLRIPCTVETGLHGDIRRVIP